MWYLPTRGETDAPTARDSAVLAVHRPGPDQDHRRHHLQVNHRAMKAWTWAHQHPRAASLTLWGSAALVLISSLMFSCEERLPSNVLVAPVGMWTEALFIAPGTCMSWDRRRPSDQFYTQLRGNTGDWYRQQATTNDAVHVRFTSATNAPAQIVINKRPAPC